MVQTIVIIALVAVALVSGAIVASYRRFAGARATVLAYLKAAAPEISLEGLTDTGFRVRDLGAGIDVDLVTLLRKRARGTPDRVWHEQVLADIRARVPQPEPPPLALVQDRIVPQLKPVSYVDLFEHYPEPQRLISRSFSAEIAITYTITGTHQLTSVTRRTLDVWGKSASDLHELAIANLRTQTAHLLTELGGPRARYEHLDGLDATRILAPDLIVPAGVVDPLIAIPGESVLLIAPGADREPLAVEAAQLRRTSSRPLTSGLFRVTPQGPVPLDPP